MKSDSALLASQCRQRLVLFPSNDEEAKMFFNTSVAGVKVSVVLVLHLSVKQIFWRKDTKK